MPKIVDTGYGVVDFSQTATFHGEGANVTGYRWARPVDGQPVSQEQFIERYGEQEWNNIVNWAMHQYITIREAAEWANISPTTLYSAAQEGRLDAYKSGATWLVTRYEVERFMDA